MFSLTHKILCYYLRICCFISNNRNFSRTSKHVNSNPPIKHTLGFGHKPVTWANEDPSLITCEQAKGHTSNSLNSS